MLNNSATHKTNDEDERERGCELTHTLTTHSSSTMMYRRSNSLVFMTLAVLFILDSTDAFTSSSRPATTAKKVTTTIPSTDTTTTLYQFGKKKKTVEDLSFIETRDLTREEMLNINKRNEEVMNRELQAMTGISVLFSIPILYLCWVAFFSD
jgi:hypothetical protein